MAEEQKKLTTYAVRKETTAVTLCVVKYARMEISLPYGFGPESRGHWWVKTWGTADEIAQFIERWVPTSPDPALMNEALEELATQVPEGVL